MASLEARRLWRRREKAQAAAIATVLGVLAIQLAAEPFTLREVLALVIAAPSAVMLAYYLAFPEEDRAYNIGLYTLILLIGLAVYGGKIYARILAAVFLAVVAVLVLASHLGGDKGRG